MDTGNSLRMYMSQLKQVDEALQLPPANESDLKDLLELKDDLTQLITISLTAEAFPSCSSENGTIASSEKKMQTEKTQTKNDTSKQLPSSLDAELSDFYKDISGLENKESEFTKTGDQKTQKSATNDVELVNFYSEIEKEETFNKHEPTRTFKSTKQLSSDPLINDRFLDNIENMNDISGVKCQAPFITEWSGVQYHNAMIKSLVGKNGHVKGFAEDIRIEVLFLNPVMQNMCPCPYYLDGNCKFEEDKCRFSHGYIVSLYELRPYAEPDYTGLMEGSTCIAKSNEGIWKPATVEKIEDHYYHVKFLHKNITLCLELHDLLPQITHHEDVTIDSDDDMVSEITNAKALYSRCGSSSLTGDPVSIGLWEEHTKGFGSRLMEMMGYKAGQGLGKTSQGRLEPVPIILLPPGKSLDHCMKIREEKGIRKINDRPGMTQESANGSNRRKRNRGCVFSFLNKTLGNNIKTKTDKKLIEQPKDLFGIKEGSEKKNSKNFNKEMFKNDEDMKKIKAKINKCKEALKRNQGNPSVTKSLKEKMEKLKVNLKNIEEYDSKINVHKSRMETHRKMTMF